MESSVPYGIFHVAPAHICGRCHLHESTGFSRASFLAIKVDGATGDLTDTHVLWMNHKSMPKTPSPNYMDGNIITLEDDGRLQSLNSETGEQRWMEPAKRQVLRIAGARVICSTSSARRVCAT